MPNQSSPLAHADDSVIRRGLTALRRRWWLVVLVTLVALVAAIIGTSARTAKYEATAEILVTPYTQQDPELAGIRIVRASNDGARDLLTAKTLLTTSRTTTLVANALGGRISADQVENDVTLTPQGGSNIIAVTAKDEDPELAAQVANSYASLAISQRNAAVAAQARLAIAGIDRLTNPDLASVRQQLRFIRDQGDPTLQLSQSATVPTSPSGPSDGLIIVAALIVGLGIGVAAAILVDNGDRRVRDRSVLLKAVPAPVLVGVPMSQRGYEGIDMPPAVREAFRTLQIQLDLRPKADCRRILVTSASSGDGKTTTVLNLAFALISAGHRVIVIDFDVRKPDLARQLEVADPTSLVTTLATGEGLTALMRPAPRLPPLRVVQVANGAGDVAMLPTLTRRMEEILAETLPLADYVLVDTPPIGEVSDALPLTGHVDDVLVVGRPGATDARALDAMAGLFDRTGVVPSGWIITGAETTDSAYIDSTGSQSAFARLSGRGSRHGR